MVWIDMKQADQNQKNGDAAIGQEDEVAQAKKKAKGYENWWPGMRRWQLGVMCEDATLELGEPEVFAE